MKAIMRKSPFHSGRAYGSRGPKDPGKNVSPACAFYARFLRNAPLSSFLVLWCRGIRPVYVIKTAFPWTRFTCIPLAPRFAPHLK